MKEIAKKELTDGNDHEEMIRQGTPRRKKLIEKPPTTIIVGDSMTKYIDSERISKSVKHSRVFLESYRGADIEAMGHHVKPCLRKQPNNLILHVGANDIRDKTASEVADGIVDLCQNISIHYSKQRL